MNDLIRPALYGAKHRIIALNKIRSKYCSVIWPDQIYLSIITIKRTIDFFIKKKSILCFPVYKKKIPYAYIL